MTPELNNIYAGDCVEVMREWPENFVDTIITDPPYGLDFMGKDWDGDVPGAHFWGEMFRVCKPGAMLLAFGGTRTWHHLAMAIEKAGWQIRDCLMWLYASGFPKSLNFGCKCGGKNATTEQSVRPMQDADLPPAINLADQSGEVLFAGVPKQGASSNGAKGAESETSRGEQSGLEWRQLRRTREGLSDDLNASSSGSQSERVRSRTSNRNGKGYGALSNGSGSGSSHRPRPGKQRSGEPEAIRESSGTLDNGTSPKTQCSQCGGLTEFAGYGTALKPAWEPIIVAMKPLDGTFAQNAEKWGVAGINVDGGRIKTFAESFTDNRADKIQQNAYGRWPANLLLDEEAAGMLDGESGLSSSSSSSSRPPDKGGTGNCFMVPHPNGGERGHNDSGGASRFFYVAKSGRAERNEGCEDLPTVECQTGCSGDMPVDDNGTQRDRFKKQAQNHHPTVKPLSLMKYLCQLTRTPTGGIVLDPFAGSGTTLWAAEYHNRPWIGIEMNPEYVAIANARIARERSQMKMAI